MAYAQTTSRTAPASDDRVISLGEAAIMAGVSPWTLKRRAQAGDLHIVRMSPRRVGIRRSELERWILACTE